MNGNYKETHEKILNIGKDMFLEFGFKQTNLRDLCKKAGVTTGAFYRHFQDKESLFNAIVDPIVNEMENIFLGRTNDFKGNIDYIDQNSFKDYSSGSSNFVIDFMYDNFDVFKLLIECSEGTKYEDFIEYVTNLENRTVLGALNDVQNKNWEVEGIDDNMTHMITHAFYSCLFEVIIHNYKKEEALKYAEKIGKFFSAGFDGLIFDNTKGL